MKLFILLLWSTICVGGEVDGDHAVPVPMNDEPQEVDYVVAEEYGFSRQQIKAAYKKVKKKYNAKTTEREVAASLDQSPVFAKNVDRAIAALVDKAGVVLKSKGFHAEAAQIKTEYVTKYSTAVVDYEAGSKYMGEHEPLSIWLKELHEKIESLIGIEACKFFHLHSIWVLNYSIPVVFNVEKYRQREYLVHFAGRPQILFYWDHHGLSGTVAYFLVNVACSAGTAGMGAISFVCGTIAGFSEHLVDKNIAPPIGNRIWLRAHPDGTFPIE